MKLIGEGLFQLNYKDLVKGAFMAFLTAVCTALLSLMEADAQHLPTLSDVKSIVIASLSVGVIYLLKNFITNSDGKILKKETT